MPKALSCRMTGAKLLRCISGTVEGGSFSKSSSDVKNMGRMKRRRQWWGASTYCLFNTPPILSFAPSYKIQRTCVQPEALPRTVSSGSPRSLAGRGLGDGRDHQRFDGVVGVVGSQLYESAVNDEHNAIYGNGGLSYVRGHNDLQGKKYKNNKERVNLYANFSTHIHAIQTWKELRMWKSSMADISLTA